MMPKTPLDKDKYQIQLHHEFRPIVTQIPFYDDTDFALR